MSFLKHPFHKDGTVATGILELNVMTASKGKQKLAYMNKQQPLKWQMYWTNVG